VAINVDGIFIVPGDAREKFYLNEIKVEQLSCN